MLFPAKKLYSSIEGKFLNYHEFHAKHRLKFAQENSKDTNKTSDIDISVEYSDNLGAISDDINS